LAKLIAAVLPLFARKIKVLDIKVITEIHVQYRPPVACLGGKSGLGRYRFFRF
jgi:hypothetical protein